MVGCTTVEKQSVLISALGTCQCIVDFSAGRIFTALLAQCMLISHYSVELHIRELVTDFIITVSFELLSIDDHFGLAALHALFDTLKPSLSALCLGELFVLDGHVLQDLYLSSLHPLVVTPHLSTHRRRSDAWSTVTDNIAVVGILPQLLPFLDLVRIDLGKRVRRDARPLVLDEVVIGDRHVDLLPHVVLTIFRKDFMEKAHVVENLLAVND